MRPAAVLAHALLWAGALGGCSVTVQAPLDPALFPPLAAAPAPAPDAVAIHLPPADAALRVNGPALKDLSASQVELPVGAIVQAAAVAAFGAEFARAATVDDPAAAPAGSLRVVVTAVQFDYRDEWVYLIPLGPFPMSRDDVTTRLSLELRVLAADGTMRWSRRYDTGRTLWKRPGLTAPQPETAAHGVQRLAHEQAVQLLRQAAQDVHRWRDAEQGRARVL